MFHHQHHRPVPSPVCPSRVEIDRHGQHQGEESIAVAATSSSAHHHRHRHRMGFNINPSLPPLTSSSLIIPNSFGAHQLDSMLGSAPDQPAAASPPAQIPTTAINPWAWTSAEEGALLLSKKKELVRESSTNNSDPKNEKKKRSIISESNSDNTGARRNLMMVMMNKKKKKKKVMNNSKTGIKKKLREPRFCFKTMSEVDVLDDGYKWRKYGQKVVKNTQHPRSYYRCTQDSCRVKKRIERLAEDPRMVITTYEGRHVHSPSHDDDPARISSKLNLFWQIICLFIFYACSVVSDV